MPHTICYISNSVKLLQKNQLQQLFKQCITNNTEKGITGILLYREGTFLQILEGNKEIIQSIFATIKNDGRHNHISKILDREIQDRLFTNYQTGFSLLNKDEDLNRLTDFLKSQEDTSHSHAILALISPFLLRYA